MATKEKEDTVEEVAEAVVAEEVAEVSGTKKLTEKYMRQEEPGADSVEATAVAEWTVYAGGMSATGEGHGFNATVAYDEARREWSSRVEMTGSTTFYWPTFNAAVTAATIHLAQAEDAKGETGEDWLKAK